MSRIKNSDKPDIHRGLSMPEIIKFYGVSYSSLEETEEQMNWYSNLEKSKSGMWWAIRFKDSKKFCGAIGFNDYHDEHKKAEIGFWLFPEYWGKGIIKEAGKEIIQYLFSEKEIHRLEAYVEAGNKNSSRVLEKLGFNFEGRMIDSEIKNGKYISVDLYALLNDIE
ncbi:GNAT family N-acetyltransferase [Gramella lutea]|uniref:GNAT family N-acetyltransferase n=1 Tax=Christiangramia lutea TaxID=1607951 RepID=A0A9X1V3A2_9FLAO|nr:GNAT family N-acetyltransferase [Christiangramia lutea]MCH4823368.1 GNAT family N-acetyltransferase [Christiangramia lutea]